MPEPTTPRPEGLPETMLQPVSGAFLDDCEPDPAVIWRAVEETHGPHPYVHLTYGPWEPSGHQCGDILPEGCDDPVDERKVTAQINIPGKEHLIGWELRACPACTDVPDDIHKLAVAAGNANDALPEDERDMTPHHILAAVIPEIERRAVEAERAAIISGIKHYFSPVDDEMWAEAQTLCGRIERGEYGARKEGR